VKNKSDTTKNYMQETIFAINGIITFLASITGLYMFAESDHLLNVWSFKWNMSIISIVGISILSLICMHNLKNNTNMEKMAYLYGAIYTVILSLIIIVWHINNITGFTNWKDD